MVRREPVRMVGNGVCCSMYCTYDAERLREWGRRLILFIGASKSEHILWLVL